ncbi:glycosyltransferase family 2 protein [Vibrio mimicus]
MKLFISVINHNHDEIICASDTLKNLSLQHIVVIRSNTEPTEELKRYSKKSGIHLVTGDTPLGFASNNNAVFRFCKDELDLSNDDYFLVLNPDVDITPDSIMALLSLSNEYNSDISAINLFKDQNLTEYDNSIRRYHTISSPLKSLFGYERTDIYNKDDIKQPIKINWAAGSFLLIKSSSYDRLRGFDESYFMYFEDADLCTRANSLGMSVIYFPNIKAVHYASHMNRNIFSKHFIWYSISAFRYHFKKFLSLIKMN